MSEFGRKKIMLNAPKTTAFVADDISTQIKSEIDALHRRGSTVSSYTTLLNQVNQKYRVRLVKYNAFQLLSRQCWDLPHRYHYKQIGRGGGKTTDAGGLFKAIAEEMPRGAGLIESPTYGYLLDRILPSLKDGLEKFGIYEGLHYFIRSKPPTSWKWEKAYKSPTTNDKQIHFWTGFQWNLISQDVAGDGRGLNIDVRFSDESQMLDWEKRDENTTPTMRGSNKVMFEKSRFFLKTFDSGTMPLDKMGKWFFDLEAKQAELDAINPTLPIKDRRFLFFNIKAPAAVNAANLPISYFQDAEEAAKAKGMWVQYRAEYWNERPPSVEDGFYGLLSEKTHGYRNAYNGFQRVEVGKPTSQEDADCVATHPLILGVDFGTAINCMAVCQHLTTINEFRALKSLFVLGVEGQIQTDLVMRFHEYYKNHKSKQLYLWYDATGNIETGFTRLTRAQEIQKQLSKLGWSVALMTHTHTNPHHEEKYYLYQAMLKGDHPFLPKFRINLLNARELYISMANAQVKRSTTGMQGIKKDKSSEGRLKGGERQYATDLSDAFDTVTFGMFRDIVRFGGGYMPQMVVR